MRLCTVIKEATAFSESQLVKIDYLFRIGYTGRELVTHCGDNVMRNLQIAARIRDKARAGYNEHDLEKAEENYAAALLAAVKIGERV